MKKNETEIENGIETGTEQAPANADPGSEPVVAIMPENVTPEQLDDLKQRAAKADEHWDRLLRSIADFDNFKKRAAREKQEAIKFANEALLEKIDARLCVTCHSEHRPEITHAMGVTQPDDFCAHCHEGIAEERPSHQNMAFNTCTGMTCTPA